MSRLVLKIARQIRLSNTKKTHKQFTHINKCIETHTHAYKHIQEKSWLPRQVEHYLFQRTDRYQLQPVQQRWGTVEQSTVNKNKNNFLKVKIIVIDILG